MMQQHQNTKKNSKRNMSPSSDVSGDNLLTRNTSLANCLDMVRIIQTYSDQDKHKKIQTTTPTNKMKLR